MHPSSVLQLVLLNILISSFAAGQQSFYSINGQHQQSLGASSSSSSSSSTPLAYQSHQQQSPNLPTQSVVGGSTNNYQQTSHNHGLNQQLSYGVNSQQQQQQHSTYQAYNQPASQSQQHYSYAPAPLSHSQNSQLSQPQYGQYSTNVQQASAPSTSSQPQYQQSYYNQQQQYYGSTPVTYSQQSYAAGTTQQQQSAPVAYAPATYDPSSSASPLPYQQQSQQSNQNQFSNRVLGYTSTNPYGSQPTLAMGAPTTSSMAVSTFSQPSLATAGPVGISQSQFLSRRGPFDGMISRVKEWMPNGKRGGKPPYSAGMSEMNRLPKPPKYPLYDMPTAGMATPPPPPLMSPMSNMPSGMYSSFSNPIASGSAPQPQRGGRPSSHLPSSHPSGSGPSPPRRLKNNKQPNKRRRNRPPPPPPPSPPKYRQNKRGQRPRVKNVKLTSPRNNYASKPLNAIQEGFDHPMASNLSPVNSPPLGRPLGYDEYMKKPTHSFTDDPWNFDPNAQSYNEGMNTYAMKYNYDPLGMNALDTSVQTHLDANKMSYPGDVMNMESYKERPKPLSSQLGGWDTYSSNNRHHDNNNNNNNNNNGNTRNNGNNRNNNNDYNNNNNNNYNSKYNSHRSGNNDFSRFDDHDGAPTVTFEDVQSSTKNSFNQYDPVTEASIVKAETMNPLTLLGDSGGTIEFDLDSTLRGLTGGHNGDGKYNDDSRNSDSRRGNNNGGDDRSPMTDSQYNNRNNYNYKLSDDYSPSDDSGSPYQNSQSSSPYDSQSDSNNYDHYSNSNYYNNYSKGNVNSEYARRHIRANPAHHPLRSSNSHNVKLNKSQSSSLILSSPPVLDEGMGLFHDFIKDPSPGSGKARARHSLYKALLS